MNYLPPPQPILNKDIRISGDVEVHPTASLAQGVILQAAPDCKITVGADVCIGMGAIISAAQSSIEIDSGAIIGSGVLIIDAGKIGSNCCIGTSSTIFQQDVAEMKVIEPGSILGDLSREWSDTGDTTVKAKTNKKTKKNKAKKKQQKAQSKPQPGKPFNPQVADNFYFASPSVSASVSPPVTPPINSPTTTPVSPVETTNTFPIERNKQPVVGQLYINELLITLFPNSKKARGDRSSGF